jgi:predicted PurR-regulated permease PerM
MEKQKWFQHIQRISMEDTGFNSQKINLILNILSVLGAVFLIFFIFIDTKIEGDNIRQYTKTKDSLEGVIQMYQKEYKVLKKHSDKLDSIINNQTEKVKYIKKNFYIFKTPTINNPDSATKYIRNFIKE